MSWFKASISWQYSFHTSHTNVSDDGLVILLSDSEDSDSENSEDDEIEFDILLKNQKTFFPHYTTCDDYPTGSNLWKIKAAGSYSIKLDSSGPTDEPIRESFTKTFDYRDCSDDDRNINLDSVLKMNLTSELYIPKSLVGSVTVTMEDDRESGTRSSTKRLSLMDETEGFFNLKFVFENGLKLYGNKEALSACSPVLEKIFEVYTGDSFKIGNVLFDDFHTCLKMVHPNCRQNFDENRVLEIMRLGAAYKVPRVMCICENIAINSKKEYTDEELDQLMEIAEEHNLNKLKNYLYEEMNKCQFTFVPDEAAMLAKAEEEARTEIELMMQLGEDYIRSFQGMLDGLGEDDTDYEDEDVEDEECDTL